MSQPQVIELVEFQPLQIDMSELPMAIGERLWREFGKEVLVEFPSPGTGGLWRLTNRGWAGYLPLTPDIGILLTPKVLIGNLFRMLAYAYELKDLRFFDNLIDVGTIQDTYEQLAMLLARRVLDRTRRGLHRAYRPKHERLIYVRGKIDVLPAIQSPWRVNIDCYYREHSADIEDNQILAWTLERIARSGLCRGEALRYVTQACRSLRTMVTAVPFEARDSVGRHYTRLNDDYETLHGLCRFFLEEQGPVHELGDRRMIPFLINMAQLFERFLTSWLATHMPTNVMVRPQQVVTIGQHNDLKFQIDIVLSGRASGQTLCVLDTKYKVSPKPDPGDVQQAVTYAELMGCQDTLLVYPSPQTLRMNEWIGRIRLHSLGFDLGQDLVSAGRDFERDLMSIIDASTNAQQISQQLSRFEP